MDNESVIYKKIDSIRFRVDKYQNKQLFDIEWSKRNTNTVNQFVSDNDIIKTFSYLIAYSQNSNSERVEQVINNKYLEKAFENFDIEKVVNLNPCDIADNHWVNLKGIRQQAKLFHIVSLARKIKRLGSFSDLLNDNNIPKRIISHNDIEKFWIGFNELQKILIKEKIPFFQSTTTLLHFLLEIGYDCAKPDLVIMKVAKKLGIVLSETGDKNFRIAIKSIQEYSVERSLRPSIVDLYFLIDGGQEGAKKYVLKEFYS